MPPLQELRRFRETDVPRRAVGIQSRLLVSGWKGRLNDSPAKSLGGGVDMASDVQNLKALSVHGYEWRTKSYCGRSRIAWERSRDYSAGLGRVYIVLWCIPN